MSLGVIAAIAYGILSLAGGIIGYVQAKSKMSLFLGSVSGILLIIGGILQQQNITGGLLLSTLITVSLLAIFAIRLTKTRKFMPAGMMLIFGVIALILQLQELLVEL